MSRTQEILKFDEAYKEFLDDVDPEWRNEDSGKTESATSVGYLPGRNEKEH